MTSLYSKQTWIAAAAIFSMFFGAGNTIFPLTLGVETGHQAPYACVGLLVTAIGAPLLGLIAATLFHGDMKAYFHRLGKKVGSSLVLLCLLMLGPVGALPRCFTVAHAALIPFFPEMELWTFSLFFGGAALICCFKGSSWFRIMGGFLSPVLLACLAMIIFSAWGSQNPSETIAYAAPKAMAQGIATGYKTMDLIAALFFSTSIWMMVQIQSKPKGCQKAVFRSTLSASIIAGVFLAIIYIGLCCAAAGWKKELLGLPGNELMTHLAMLSLGEHWGLVANIAIALACLTTVVGLAETISLLSLQFAPWLGGSQKTRTLLTITTSILVAPLGFSVIGSVIAPIMALCYPAMIVLALCNILYKLFDWKPVKRPFWLAVLATVAIQLI